MNKIDVQALPVGLYRIKWKWEDGYSLAAVGMGYNGDRWIAPVNWTSPCPSGRSAKWWRQVESAELIQRAYS